MSGPDYDLPFDPDNHLQGGRRVYVVCADEHERVVIAEFFADGDRWRSDGYVIAPDLPRGYTGTRQAYRVLRTETGDRAAGDLCASRHRSMSEDHPGPQYGQYRLSCGSCNFNEVRNDVGEVGKRLFDVFDRLVDNWPGPGVAEIDGRRLTRIAWAGL